MGKVHLTNQGNSNKKKSNHTTAFKASAQTIKDHICSSVLAKVIHTHLAMENKRMFLL